MYDRSVTSVKSKSQITQLCDTNKNVKDSKMDDII